MDSDDNYRSFNIISLHLNNSFLQCYHYSGVLTYA